MIGSAQPQVAKSSTRGANVLLLTFGAVLLFVAACSLWLVHHEAAKDREKVWKPQKYWPLRPLGDHDQAKAGQAKQPKGISPSVPSKVVWLGNCSEYWTQAASYKDIIAHTFPDHLVKVVQLSDTCDMLPGSTQRPDIIFYSGWGFSDVIKAPIEGPREAAFKALKQKKSSLKLVSSQEDMVYTYKSLLTPKHKGERTIAIGINDEWRASVSVCFDVIIDVAFNVHRRGASLWWPLASRLFWPGLSLSADHQGFAPYKPVDLVRPDGLEDAAEVLRGKTEFLAFAASRCDDQFYDTCYKEGCGSTITMRAALFDLIKESYKEGTALGQCRSVDENKGSCKNRDRENDPDCAKRGRTKGTFVIDMIRKFRPFKFALAMENTIGQATVDGYITEKLIAASLARTVPVYTGSGIGPSEHLANMINTDAIIYCHLDVDKFTKAKFDTAKPSARIDHTKANPTLRRQLLECLDQIKELDQNDELYKAKLASPILPNNRVEGSIFDINRIGKNLRNAICKMSTSDLCT